METTCKIDIIERNGEATDVDKRPQLKLENHCDDFRLVVLEIAGERVTVKVEELRTAIDFCTDSGPRSQQKLSFGGYDIPDTLFFKGDIVTSDYNTDPDN